MATFYTRKNSPYYYIGWMDASGKMRYKSSRIRVNEPGALKKVHEVVKEVERKEAVLKSDSVRGHFKSWVPDLIDQERNEKTRYRYRNAWRWLFIFFEGKRVLHPAEVTYDLIMEFFHWRLDPEVGKKFNWRKHSKNGVLMEIKCLSRMMSEAVRKGLILYNPCFNLGIKKDPVKEKREITRAEEAKILKELNKKRSKLVDFNDREWMLGSFLVAMKQGCRLSEVKVPLDMIDFEMGTVRFKVKGFNKYHTAPLHNDVRALALERKAAGAKFLVDLPDGASRAWGRFFERLDLSDLCFHCTRVTVVTRLARAGYSEAQCMQYVGHASDVVHAVYRKLKAADVAALGSVL